MVKYQFLFWVHPSFFAHLGKNWLELKNYALLGWLLFAQKRVVIHHFFARIHGLLDNHLFLFENRKQIQLLFTSSITISSVKILVIKPHQKFRLFSVKSKGDYLWRAQWPITIWSGGKNSISVCCFLVFNWVLPQ